MKVKVEIIESERGWGQKVDSTKEFPSRAKAEAFVKKYNAKNDLPEVPDWYMYARIVE
jgi:hypothetical protein